MKGAVAAPIDPELDRHRAHTQLLPMVMESMDYGPMIPSHRKFMKILVVNSHPDVLTFFDNYLTLKGCEVLSMANGHLASDALLVEDFDIAFIELTMADYDGLALMRTFREMVATDEKDTVAKAPDDVMKFDSTPDPSPGMAMLQSGANAAADTDTGGNSEVYKPVLTYNPNMLIVGMESSPFSRSPDALAAGMRVLCPMPMDVRFIGRIIATWRMAASMTEGVDEINANPPSLHNDEYENNSTSGMLGKEMTESEKERKEKRRERKEEKKTMREKEKTARESKDSNACGWLLTMLGFGGAGRRRRGADKVAIRSAP